MLDVRQGVDLAPYTTLGVGGNALWFATARTESDVADAAQFARDRKLPIFVLGGGSNLLVSDAGFLGLVLRMAIPGIHLDSSESPAGEALVHASAGESWDTLVRFAVDCDLAGIECLAGIPGTVGGTPVQNVGAYGQEVGQTITLVRCFDLHTFAFVELSNRECAFAYRASLLNTSGRGRFVVTRVDFRLCPGGAPNLSYADLQKRFPAGSSPSLSEVSEAVRAIRRGKGMVVDPADPDSRSAGSFFRNPLVSPDSLQTVASALGIPAEQVPHWPAGNLVKLPAAWLLEQAGFVRGYAMGSVGVSSRHTLALVNRGGATERDVTALKNRIVATVRQRFGIQLEQEPVSVGDLSPAASTQPS